MQSIHAGRYSILFREPSYRATAYDVALGIDMGILHNFRVVALHHAILACQSSITLLCSPCANIRPPNVAVEAPSTGMVGLSRRGR